MAHASLRVGLPLGGLDLRSPVTVPAPEPHAWSADELDGIRFRANGIRSFGDLSPYATDPDNRRVTRLYNVLWGDGSADVIRHVGNEVHRVDSTSTWVSIRGALALAAGDTDYWGSALVPGNTGRGYYLASTRSRAGALPHIYFWDGAAAAVSQTWASGSPDPSRFIIPFADRSMLFNQLTAASSQYRRCQWSQAGNGIAFAGTGSGAREFSEFDGEITGVAPLRDDLFVYSERGIVRGRQSFDVDAPVYYDTITARGVGNWAMGSLTTYSDFHAFLSHEGFKAFDGTQIIDIGAPINQHILENINAAAIDTVFSVTVPPPVGIAMWGLPMGINTLPSELWCFDFVGRRWSRVTTLPAGILTAASLLSRSPGPTWDTVAGTWDTIVGTWDSLGGQVEIPNAIFGLANGATYRHDPDTFSSSVGITIDTPGWSFEGTPLFDSARGRPDARISPGDLVTADDITLTYRSFDPSAVNTCTLQLLVSINGEFFNPVASFVLTGGDFNRVRRVRATLRVSGAQLKFRLTNIDPATGFVSPGFFLLEDIAMTVRRSGTIRSASPL